MRIKYKDIIFETKKIKIKDISDKVNSVSKKAICIDGYAYITDRDTKILAEQLLKHGFADLSDYEKYYL